MTKTLSPRQSLNKTFLKVKPNRIGIDLFRKNLIRLFSQIDKNESEEFHKNVVSGFLNQTYYSPANYINTKGRNDLVIHTGKDAKSPVGVIIETKSPSNKTEMLSEKSINTKALHELLLYYLRERITHKNLEIKHLVATNIYEWFIFDAALFEKYFGQNKELVQKFTDFDEGRLAGKNTDFFYKEIAEPAFSFVKEDISYTHFDFRDYEKIIRNDDRSDDVKLIALYKLLSPEHLLKLPFTNDSNSLDKTFYTELLHIIGLAETKDGGKKLIQRKKPDERNVSSLIENVIDQLESLDKLSKLDKPSQFGENNEERLFNIALELSITWVNRVLFLKLMEAQLIAYNKGNKDFAFMNPEKVNNYDDLNSLFFQVLARKMEERTGKVKELFKNVPYLNSSLFEPTDLEQLCFFISQLPDQESLPLHSSTVLKDANGKKRTGSLLPLQYLFEFLDAYDFSSEGSEEIQEENKTLINASVLGLIFEKINGYKDGSFFTPGFITMYMCRETIRRAVLQKFSEVKNWNCENLVELHNKIDDKKEANKIINSIKICDPAVGSGHFLVSALNEIIAIKGELKILLDREGKTLKDYGFEVVNDELIITDEDGNLFDYNPRNKESQRLQEALFHEKETIIENCLFGVDINPNSVKICRLRLWIELLKNAYYKQSESQSELNRNELETLPNIDINIKCGNSLISRFALDADMKQALKKSKWNIDSYRIAVQTYRNAQTKEEKRSMEKLINDIKSDFRSEISSNDPKLKKLSAVKGELINLTQQMSLFDMDAKHKAEWNKKVEKLTKDISSLEVDIEEIKNNKIYEKAFEWRFEFPEVLNDDGDFVGFDVVIGNPPYGVDISNELYRILFSNKTDSYQLFVIKSLTLCKTNYYVAQILPNSWLSRKSSSEFRQYLFKKDLEIILNFITAVFEDANIDTCICILKNSYSKDHIINTSTQSGNESILNIKSYNKISLSIWKQLDKISCSISEIDMHIIDKLKKDSLELEKICLVVGGYKPYQIGYGKSVYGDFPQIAKDVENRVYHSEVKIDDSYYPDIKGLNINKYYITPNTKWVKWGSWLMSPKNKEYFVNPKLIVREIVNDGLISAFDDSGLFTNDTTHLIIHESIEVLKFILAILNSRLIAWYFKKYYGEENDLFPKVKINEIKSLPINFKINENVLGYVNKAIDSKKANIDISNIENKIDQLVYQLYGLTEEEIAIVEQATKN